MRRLLIGLALAAAIAVGCAVVAVPASAAAKPPPASAPGGGAHRPHYYVALGDSLSVGIQPNREGTNVATRAGYPDQLYRLLRFGGTRLRLVKLGCSGETTATFASGGICGYRGDRKVSSTTPEGSQLAAATAFLRSHPGRVSLITIDIGINDISPCEALGGTTAIEQCLADVVPQTVQNLTEILTQLRAAGGSNIKIIGMTYYDPALAGWLTGPAGQQSAQLSVGLLNTINGLWSGAYTKFGAAVADVYSAFDTADFTGQVQLPGIGTVPRNVALICEWTWGCTAPPQGPNVHANRVGYAVIARTFLAADLASLEGLASH